MGVEVILLIEYPNFVSELENANETHILSEIKNILTKGNKRCYVNVLYIVYRKPNSLILHHTDHS